MFSKANSPEDALRASITVLDQVVSLYDRLGLTFPAVHAATALQAAHFALEEGAVTGLDSQQQSART
ncbi:hypothetical protein [Novosphingobium beihaiensis]|uniref:Uncharacterized protein n=1 Tax=Novosphingobium beihaiensis TaxID=2930389 RepID=A0ABT0BNC9_9SPHN|nr:hypothetical protein [Novosphingobium beihaiensis]MCJ2186557.1 hypothetical protein [Novosphingobium beihaiensis]